MFEKSKYALPKSLERKVTPKNYGQLIARQGKKKRKRPKKIGVDFYKKYFQGFKCLEPLKTATSERVGQG